MDGDMKPVKVDWTDDEMNNFLIDLWKEKNKEIITSVVSPVAGKSVTITLSRKNFCNYLDLEEQNN